MNTFWTRFVIVLGLVLGGLFLSNAQAATYLVTTTADSGTGSLRSGITYANANPGTTIEFRIPGVTYGGYAVISIYSTLPTITTDGTSILGASQTKYGDNNPTVPDIVIDASSTYDNVSELQGLLSINASNCVVNGLMFTNFAGTAMSLGYNSPKATSNNTVQGCWFGLNPDGKSLSRRVSSDGWGPACGLRIFSSRCRIGGTRNSDTNVFAGLGLNINPITKAESFNGRGYGIWIEGDYNEVDGNTFGMGTDGTTPLKNHIGVRIKGYNNRVWFNEFGSGWAAVAAEECDGATIESNDIGLNSSRSAAMGPFTHGVYVYASSGLSISSNRFANCTFSGILTTVDPDVVPLNLSAGCEIRGNTFGVNLQGKAITRVVCGVFVCMSGVTIGGTGMGQPNTFDGCASAVNIAGSSFPDESVFYPEQVTVRANVIKNSTNLGINIAASGDGPNGQTWNDTLDVDTGANGKQNYPDLSKVEVTHNGSSIVIGKLNSKPSRTYTLDFYANTNPSVSGYGDGQRYIGNAQVTTDTQGNASFSLPFKGGKYGDITTTPVAPFDYVSATATDADGNTSEFSLAVQATVVSNRAPAITTITVTPSSPQTNSRLTITPKATDADGDPVTFSYTWTKSGVVLAGQNGATLDLSQAGNGDRGDLISVVITPNDGVTNGASEVSATQVANTAPDLNGAAPFSLKPMAEDDNSSQGTSIEEILASGGAGAITDEDTADKMGIAVLPAKVAGLIDGFEFSLDSGVSWTKADFQGHLLLAANGKTRIRVLSEPNANGEANILFKAWDGSYGTNGTAFPDIPFTSTSPVSQQAAKLKVTVTPVDDVPGIGVTPPSLTIDEDAPEAKLILVVGDPDSSPEALTLAASSPNQALIANDTIDVSLFSVTDSYKAFRVKFRPAPDANGSATLDLTATSGALSVTKSVSVTILPVNDAPTLTGTPSSLVAAEDQTLDIAGLSATDIDGDGDYELTAAFTGGTGHFAGSGDFVPEAKISGNLDAIKQALAALTFRGAPNWSGIAEIAITLKDETFSVSRVLEIAVSPVNDLPTLSNVTEQTVEEGKVPGPLAFQVDDAETAAASLLVAASSDNPALLPPSALVLGGGEADRTLQITPAAGLQGSALITLSATDADGATGTTSFRFTVTEKHPNVAPTITAPTTVKTSEEKSVNVGSVKVSDTDAEGGVLQLSWTSTGGTATLGGASSPISGTLEVLNQTLSKSFTFVPTPNFFGNASLTLTLDDNGNSGAGGPRTAHHTITITVSPVNDSPKLSSLTFAGTENRDLSSKLQGTDIDGDKLTYTLLRKPLNGTLTLQSDGAFGYTPKLNWNGSDSFEASVTDPGKLSSKTSFVIKIKPVNAKPILAPDNIKGKEDIELSITAATLLNNDNSGEIQGENDPFRIIKVGVPGGFPGTLSFDKVKNLILFTPKRNWNGTTSFTYTVQDSGNAQATGTVTLQISAVNDAPVAEEAKLRLLSGTTKEFELHASDVDGDALTLALLDKPQNGTTTLSLVGAKWIARYTAKAGYTGTDSFTFVARDGKLVSTPATVRITVEGGTPPKNNGTTPNASKVPLGASVILAQKVRDNDGVAHIGAAALLLSNTSQTPTAQNAAVVWFNAQNNTFTLAKNDGTSYLTPVPLGRSLENSQVKVTLRAEDVLRGTDGSITLNWRFTFKGGWSGVKTLWSRVEDLSLRSDGFEVVGTISIGATSTVIQTARDEDEPLESATSALPSLPPVPSAPSS